MEQFSDSTPHLIAFSLLGLSVLLLWWPARWPTVVVFSTSLLYALSQSILSPDALIPIGVLAALLYIYPRTTDTPILRIGLLIALSLLSVAFGVHAFPGFTQWNAVTSVKLSEASAAYPMWFYFDKSIVGVLILLLAYETLARSRSDWAAFAKVSWLPILFGSMVVYALSHALGYTRFDPKLSEVFPLWAIKNLIFVCVAEEAFFRGFLQRQLADIITHRHRHLLALFAASVLFGIAHIAGGLNYVLLATVAGFLYGYVYYKTQRVEASILAHFLLNTGHFLFFTYPYAQP